MHVRSVRDDVKSSDALQVSPAIIRKKTRVASPTRSETCKYKKKGLTQRNYLADLADSSL